MIELYRKSFELCGHEVVTIAEPHSFFTEATYTHNLKTPAFLFRNSKGRFLRYVNILKWMVAKRWSQYYKSRLFHRYKKEIEMLVVLGDGFYNTSLEDFKYLHNANKKIVQIFFGGDARCWEAFNQEYKIDISTIEKHPINNENFNLILTRLRKAELYSNAIYSLPDQSGLAIRPFFRLYMPFECEKYKFISQGRDVPVVVHIESKQPYKGEPFIFEAIERLRNEGLQFEFHNYKNLSHKQVIEVLENADILVDEVMIFGPGTLSYEAIACGCAVATKVQPGHLAKDFMCNLEIENIQHPLRDFIINKELRIQNLQKAYDLLKNINNPENIAKDILQKVNLNEHDFAIHDFQPRYFLERYTLPEGHIVSEKNKKLTRMVFDKYVNDPVLRQSLIDRNLM